MNQVDKNAAQIDGSGGASVVPINNELLRDVQVVLDAKLGQTTLTVAELSALKSGTVLTLERSLADHVDLYLSGSLVARGEIVAVGDNFGVRLVEVASEK